MKTSNKYIITALVVIIILGLLSISIIDSKSVNTVTKNFLEYFNLIVTPICLIIGIIIGYPLIKKKLVEDYVSRQFEIMHKANRVLRKECLALMNKYPQKGISNQLDEEELIQCLSNISSLYHIAFDANPDAHKYAKLLKETLEEFYKCYPKDANQFYYKESLHSFIHVHTKQIYDYATSLGTNFDGNIVKKNRLVNKLDEFVHDNKYAYIDSVDYSISYNQTSQLLVIFFENSLHNIRYDNPLYHYASYKIAPTPCPFARILFIKEVYLPLIVKNNKHMPFGFELKLHLIGFSPRVSKNNGQEKHFYVCHYANIGNIMFVQSYIKDDPTMEDYSDIYIEETANSSLADYKVSNFQIASNAEIITFEVETELLNRMFVSKKHMLTKKMKAETHGK